MEGDYMHKQCYGDQFFSIIYLAQTFSRRYQPGYNAFVWLKDDFSQTKQFVRLTRARIFLSG